MNVEEARVILPNDRITLASFSQSYLTDAFSIIL